MKKSVMICVLVVSVCTALNSPANATIDTGWQEWGFTLKDGQSFTCLAYYALEEVESLSVDIQFTAPSPEWTETYTGYLQLGLDRDSWWTTALSPDSKVAYIYGDRVTNTTGDDLELFSFELHYQWDDSAAGFDSNYPVYQDTVLWDGFQDWGDLDPEVKWGKRGTPGNESPGDWEDSPDWLPYDGPYSNPVPEPMTICLLGLGAGFLRKRRS